MAAARNLTVLPVLDWDLFLSFYFGCLGEGGVASAYEILPKTKNLIKHKIKQIR